MKELFDTTEDLFDMANLIEKERETGGRGAYQAPIPFVLNSLAEITVPEGFRWDECEPLTWKTTIDSHTLNVVPYEITVPAAICVEEGSEVIKSMVNIFQVRLMGALYYNTVLGNFKANDEAYSDGRAVFTTSGAIAVNIILGYVANIEDICCELLDNILFEVVNENPTIIKNGETITYDPANPEAFYAAFDGSANILFALPFSVIITVNPVIS